MRIATHVLAQRASTWMREVARLGVKPGDVVALEARPDEPSVVHLMGLWAHGVVVLPLPLRYPPESWAHWARVAGAQWALSRVSLELPSLPWASQERAGSDALPCPPPDAKGGVRILTSGSTGTPKVVHLDWSALWHSAFGVNEHLHLNDAHAWLLALPLYHVGGLGIVVRTWMQGAHLAFAHVEEPLAHTLSRTRPSHLSLVPTQLRRLLQACPALLPLAEAVFLGGSAVDGTLIDAATCSGIPLYTSYGLSEMASTVTLTAPNATAAELRSAGRLLPGREMKVVEGELWVRGRTLFAGYYAEGGIQSLLTPDGWFRTGDLGYCDAGGLWHIVGRRDAMFISGGENIHPEAIERALLSVPGVEEAVVVPVEDIEFGQRPFAFLTAAVLPTLDELREHLALHIPRFMHPVGVAKLPAGSGMKPSRAGLRSLAQGLR